jgi:DNA (cytosine-5)-methyltransferase 1
LKSLKKNNKSTPLVGVSLFSSIGIGETDLKKIGIQICLANELLENRAKLYKKMYPESIMIQGDITKKEIFDELIARAPKKIEFLLATPPCQGVSIAGKNRRPINMPQDRRNYLLFSVIEFIKIKKPTYVLIENVPQYIKLYLPFKGKLTSLLDIIKTELGEEYEIESKIFDSSEFGVPQKRNRLIIKINKKGTNWSWAQPNKNKVITTRDAIGHLPSLEAGQDSGIPWHFARPHSENHKKWMQHTPTGETAFNNKVHYPKKSDGSKISGYESTYRRIKWDEPAPTITMRNDAISSQRNVHPGRLKKNGSYSDARVLTPLELMLLTSLPKNWKVPKDTTEILIRQCIGESVPPLLIKKIAAKIGK